MIPIPAGEGNKKPAGKDPAASKDTGTSETGVVELATLLGLSKNELYALATFREIEGRGSMSRDELIIILAPSLLSEEAERVIQLSSSALIAEARERNISGYSKLKKHELILALLPETKKERQQREADEDLGVVFAVRWPKYRRPSKPPSGVIIGYVTPKARAGFCTHLRVCEGVLENWPSNQKHYLDRLMATPPKGAEVLECPF